MKSNGFELQFAAPKELGGTGEGTNPEQLFAMGYASEFVIDTPKSFSKILQPVFLEPSN